MTMQLTADQTTQAVAELLWEVYSHRHGSADKSILISGEDCADIAFAAHVKLVSVVEWRSKTIAAKGAFEQADFLSLIQQAEPEENSNEPHFPSP